MLIHIPGDSVKSVDVHRSVVLRLLVFLRPISVKTSCAKIAGVSEYICFVIMILIFIICLFIMIFIIIIYICTLDCPCALVLICVPYASSLVVLLRISLLLLSSLGFLLPFFVIYSSDSFAFAPLAFPPSLALAVFAFSFAGGCLPLLGLAGQSFLK